MGSEAIVALTPPADVALREDLESTLRRSQPAISGVRFGRAWNVPGHAWAADILSTRRKRQPEV